MKTDPNPKPKDQALTDAELLAQLPKCPNAGNGVHRFLWKAARKLWELSDDDSTLIRVIREAVTNCGREVEDREIEDAVYNSSPGTVTTRSDDRTWPEVDQRRVDFVCRFEGSAEQKLQDLSPVAPQGQATAYFVDQLFPENPLLCFGVNQRSCITAPRKEFPPFNFQFMVPSRMSAIEGKTQTGKRSVRCLSNTGPRDFLVIECDSGSRDQQSAKILHLARFAPLTMALHSGGKSIHAWFNCAGKSEEELWTFMAYAVSLGADPHTWCRCQLVRVPAAVRVNGNEQRVLFFNPKNVPVPGFAGEWQFEKLKNADTDLLGVEIFFDSQSQRYLFHADCGWIPLAKENLEIQLVDLGYRAKYDKKKDGPKPLSPVKRILSEVQRTKNVVYAAPLAGWNKGLHTMNGEPILVTKSPMRIKPVPGDFSIFQKVLDNLFVDDVIDQRPYVYGWIKVAYEALEAGNIRPGQALVLAGEARCGKSLFQTIITELFGGRSAKPFRYMSGQTPFNGELFQSEHLVIEDEASSFNTAKRVEFGTRIKEITVNQTHSCHPKGRQAVQLSPFWRLSISLNNEPEHLRILPPVDDSIADKLMLLQVPKKPMPMPTDTPEQRTAFRTRITSELPAFLDWLLKWEIPAAFVNDSYGIKTFHHPELLESIKDLAPEKQLLDMLRLFLPGMCKDDKPWIASAADITNVLMRNCDPARSLLSWNGATGTYLARLARQYPNKISQKRSSEKREWEIAFDL